MDPDTQRFIQHMLSDYYLNVDMVLPPRFGRREWAFFMWGGKGMFRPVSFSRKDEVRAFLASRAPRHVYFSTAYYEDPSVPMAEKKWMGADLIFDLDADHLEGASQMTYKAMLEAVKEEFVRLVDEYVLGDMGFSENDVEIVFSGGRGYHLHVRNKRILDMGTHERREIVDYVTGNGLDFEGIFREHIEIDRPGYGGRKNIKESYRLPSADRIGWRGERINSAVRLLGRKMEEDIIQGREKDVLKRISIEPGVGKKTAQKLLSSLEKDWNGYETRLKAMQAGEPYVLDSWGDTKVMNAFLSMAKSEVEVMAAETDEPVTSDVKRLIRMPYSIHGKSSLRVVTMSREELDDFQPLEDAVVFGEEEVEIEVLKEIVCYVKGEKRFKPGCCTATEAQAMFLLCSGAASLCQER